MIEVKGLKKSYTTGSFTQKALDDVSISFRDSEFVAILGPSGSGKTTLLNIIGGLDHADSGDVIINGVSTQDYRDADWDTYRNHHIGFIFQSYNLIPHQSVLSNVEIALTLAGVSKKERRERALDALDRVGLKDHIEKRPSQLSGGQAQRVAIARALVNDPDVLLADEPTGALDTETGLTVMELLSEIAQDRLVIMVTHNPDLANQYATRIVSLADGRVAGDSVPLCSADDQHAACAESLGAMESAKAVDTVPLGTAGNESMGDTAPLSAKGQQQEGGVSASAAADGPSATVRPSGKTGKASMSFLTALSLSFSNLMTKKGRTFLTAFAGSIGIMGIAIILSLSNGVNNYIAQVEEETLSSYPITITKSSIDLDSMMSSVSSDDDTGDSSSGDEQSDSASDFSEGTIAQQSIISDMFANVENNDLSSFKSWLEGDGSYVNDYANIITYDYGVTPLVYTDDNEDPQQLSPSFVEEYTNMDSFSALTSLVSSSGSSSFNAFQELIDDQELMDSQYEVVEGSWPQSYDECVLVLDDDGSISDYTLYSIGVLDPGEFAELYSGAMTGEAVDAPESSVDFTYEDALDLSFKVVLNSDLYRYDSDQGTWTDISDNEERMNETVKDGLDLKVVGVVKARDTTTVTALSEGIAYSSELTTYLIDQNASSEIVKQQLDNPDVDVFTGKTFDELNSDSGLDLSSIVSFDEEALTSAFSMDDFGLGSFDTGDFLDIDLSSLADSIDTDAIMQSLQDAPMPELSADDIELTASQQAQLNQMSTALMIDFLGYYAQNHAEEDLTAETDLSSDFSAYLQQPSVQANLEKMYQVVGEPVSEQVEDIMTDYLNDTLVPYMQDQISDVFQEAAAQMSAELAPSLSDAVSSTLTSGSLSDDLADALQGAISLNMDEEELTQLLTRMMTGSTQSYEDNLATLGYADLDNPDSISIYPIDFDNKELVDEAIEDYNQTQRDAGNEEAVISYSDIMGTLMSSVTDIIDMISMILIAFVSVSLVVSSIMIGIITYISVLERRREIGILRAMGASKGNVASIFNAETVIEGLIAGVFAIVVVLLASIPVNAFVLDWQHVQNIMSLPLASALGLIGISVLLTFIAGLIPAMNAARRDAVEALRSE